MRSVSAPAPLRVGIVGAGFIGKMRVQAIGKMPDMFRLVAVVDERIELAQALAGSQATSGTDPLALAADPNIDAVIISTPPVSHATIGVPCLRAGKHLLIEKPLAATVQECEALVDAAERARVCLATGFTLRQTPAARLARQLIADGAIGQIDHIRAFHGHKGGKDFGPAWITDHAMTGGGSLMDNGIHMIDMARWFLGGTETIMGLASNHSWHKNGCEDNGFVLMRNAAGQIASVQGSWTEWRGYRWRMEVYGTVGAIRFSFPPLWLTLWRGTPGEKMKAKHYPFAAFQIQERLHGWQWSLVETLIGDLRDWGEAIRAGVPAPASGHDGLESVRIALCARRVGTA
ncbi:MAG: Gfo/Idh/MocA family oxidoreductase [Pseudomonadota bacterium]|nr:Gfo/Idh/MocA family oxidoreductase [Pseudomonadota bacterium]